MAQVRIVNPAGYFNNSTLVQFGTPGGTTLVPLVDGVSGASGDGQYEVNFVENELAVYGAGINGPALHVIKLTTGIPSTYDTRVIKLHNFTVVGGQIVGNRDTRTIGGISNNNIADGAISATKLAASSFQLQNLSDVSVVDSTTPNGYVLTYDTGLAKWKAAAAGGGGSGLTTPTIAQQAFNASNSGSFSVTLGSTPTAGNVLVAIVWGTSNGLNCFSFGCELYQQNNPGIYVFTRRVQSGDPANVFSISNNGNFEFAQVYEIANLNDMAIYASQISNSLNYTYQYAPIARAFSPSICLSCLVQNSTGKTITATAAGWTVDHNPTSDSNVQGIMLRRTSNLPIGSTDQAWVEWSSNAGNHSEVTVLLR